MVLSELFFKHFVYGSSVQLSCFLYDKNKHGEQKFLSQNMLLPTLIGDKISEALSVESYSLCQNISFHTFIDDETNEVYKH